MLLLSMLLAAGPMISTFQGADNPFTHSAPARRKVRRTGGRRHAPSGSSSSSGRSVYYANCSAARAAGAAPVMRGQPGYRAKLDRDNDGVGCE